MRQIVKVEIYFEAEDSAKAKKLAAVLKQHYAKFGGTISKVNRCKYIGVDAGVVEVPEES